MSPPRPRRRLPNRPTPPLCPSGADLSPALSLRGGRWATSALCRSTRHGAFDRVARGRVLLLHKSAEADSELAATRRGGGENLVDRLLELLEIEGLLQLGRDPEACDPAPEIDR